MQPSARQSFEGMCNWRAVLDWLIKKINYGYTCWVEHEELCALGMEIFPLMLQLGSGEIANPVTPHTPRPR